jgi:hypothetical protein
VMIHDVQGGPGGQTGNDSASSATGSHPGAGSSDKPLPDPTVSVEPFTHLKTIKPANDQRERS